MGAAKLFWFHSTPHRHVGLYFRLRTYTQHVRGDESRFKVYNRVVVEGKGEVILCV